MYLGPMRSLIRSGATFDPISLFASGEKGFILDPAILGNMFQLSNGTTAVTADNDPVGYILDRTTNAHALIQATAGNRPLYKTDGTKHWLLFDSSDTLQKATADVGNNVSFLTLVAVGNPTANGNNKVALALGTGAGTTRANLSIVATTGFMAVGGRRLDADAFDSANGAVDRTGAVGIFIGELDYANADQFGFYGQTAEITDTNFQTAGSTSATDGKLFLSQNNAGGSWEGTIFFAMVIARQLTSTEKNNLGTYLAAKSGATW